MISIVGRDGQPMRVRADVTPWWELDEAFAWEVSKAFDAGRNGKVPPIRIKTFRV
jgi:hypothetical protein